MKAEELWWECPKCGAKVYFGYELSTLFDEDDNQAWFLPKEGIPFYLLKCSDRDCDAKWNFGISNMFSA